ncbi:MAG: HAD family hydrolase, partial [Lachnospiraceae bacterium]|nr:HAD family hydrolase [Lachnospiraceae bacterium]
MDAIFLDIDGTLWDSTHIVSEAWNEVLSPKPEINFVVTPELLKTLFGKPLSEIAAAIFKDFPKEKQTELIDECCEREHEVLAVKSGIIFDGVVDTIKELAKKYPVCIVSNCEAGYIELVCDKLGIKDYIKDGECPGYSGLGKGDNIKLVMERNGFKDIVYVGDTQGDYEATRIAGVPFVYCKYGFGNPEGYEYSIEKFSELL